jgi:predicted O-methyltransferase YrrM
MTPEEINRILEIPQWDTTSSVKTVEARFIYDLVRQNNLSRTLETGFAFGRSAANIIAASEKQHIAMDPYQDRYKNLGLENIKKLGLEGKLDFRRDFSHNVMPELVKQAQKFDFIFIGGDHKFDGIFIDFYYSDLLLKTGGFVLFHDTWMRSTRLVGKFIKSNRKEYTFIKTPLRNLSLFQKTGEDTRDGMFFREFYTARSLLIHSLIRWMTGNRNNFIKRILLKVKDLVK